MRQRRIWWCLFFTSDLYFVKFNFYVRPHWVRSLLDLNQCLLDAVWHHSRIQRTCRTKTLPKNELLFLYNFESSLQVIASLKHALNQKTLFASNRNKLFHLQFCKSHNKTLKIKVLTNKEICDFDFYNCPLFFWKQLSVSLKISLEFFNRLQLWLEHLYAFEIS